MSAGKFDVFISYASEDLYIAQAIASDLKKQGLTVWLDRDCLGAGQRIADAVATGIRSSKLLCALVTPRYRTSNWVGIELSKMEDREGILAPTRVIALLIEGEMPGFLSDRKYIDFRRNPDSAVTELVARTKALIAEQGSRKLAAFGVATVITIALAHLSQDTTDQDDDDGPGSAAVSPAALLNVAQHQALGSALRNRGQLVPRTKADRISLLIDFGVDEHLLDELFTADDAAEIMEALGCDAYRSKKANIESIIRLLT